jgi:hypothetical protein
MRNVEVSLKSRGESFGVRNPSLIRHSPFWFRHSSSSPFLPHRETGCSITQTPPLVALVV